MNTPKSGLVTIAVLCAALTACGSSSKSSQPAQSTQPGRTTSATESNSSNPSDCPVTDDEVKAATGASSVEVGAPHGGYPGAKTCAWYLGDKTQGHTISATALANGRAAFMQTAHAPNGSDELQDGSPYESVPGLGAQASASGVGGDVNLDVLQGDDWFNCTSFDYPNADPSRKTAKGLSTDALDACTKVARAALANGAS
jgi:hypothetical protein